MGLIRSLAGKVVGQFVCARRAQNDVGAQLHALGGHDVDRPEVHRRVESDHKNEK